MAIWFPTFFLAQFSNGRSLLYFHTYSCNTILFWSPLADTSYFCSPVPIRYGPSNIPLLSFDLYVSFRSDWLQVLWLHEIHCGKWKYSFPVSTPQWGLAVYMFGRKRHFSCLLKNAVKQKVLWSIGWSNFLKYISTFMAQLIWKYNRCFFYFLTAFLYSCGILRDSFGLPQFKVAKVVVIILLSVNKRL